MNTRAEQLARIGNAFIADYAIRFDMPELLGLNFAWEENTKHIAKDCTSVRMKQPWKIIPRGQFSAIINCMEVCFTLFVDQYDRFTAEVKLDYNHHGGGSNGYRTDFFLVVKNDPFFHPKDPAEMEQDIFTYKGFMLYEHYVDATKLHMDIYQKVQATKTITA